MKWASAVSQKGPLDEAVNECRKDLSPLLEEFGPPDLAFLFVSSDQPSIFSDAGKEVSDRLKPGAMIGCSAGGVIGADREIENARALSVTCAWTPGVSVKPFHILDAGLPDLDSPPKAWHDLVGIAPDENPQFILLADPFTLRVDHVVTALDYAFSNSAKVGGLASGGREPGENALYLNQRVFREGLVGLALTGNLALDTIVAQGCRPIGQPMTVTQCQRNVLLALDGRPPLEILQGLYQGLAPRDQSLVHSSLFLGIVMDPTLESYGQGDFLIRNIIGADPEKGVLAVGAPLRLGQLVQFHLRDAKTSAEDLKDRLAQYLETSGSRETAGALLFSCLGRGAYLYGRPNHDTEMFHEQFGPVPVGGFFCNGEIGPVTGTTYLHGYTSCFGIFRPRRAPNPEENPSL